MDGIKTNQLRHFVAVVENGGFRAAAEKINRTQPALSLSIRELERLIGGKLFESGNSAALTPLGEQCLDIAKQVVLDRDRGVEQILSLSKLKQGYLRIAVVPSVANEIMGHVIANYLKEWPDIKIELIDTSSDEIYRLIKLGSVDVGVAGFKVQDPQVNFTPCYTDPIGLVCRDDHPIANQSSFDLEDLKDEVFIHNGTTSFIQNFSIEKSLTVYNMISLYSLLEKGVGVTALPKLALPARYESLKFIPITPAYSRVIGVLKLMRRSLSPAAMEIERLIHQQLLLMSENQTGNSD